MASVDKQSVRDEAERIKKNFENLASSKKMDAEIKMLFQSMLLLINLLVAVFLEKKTKKNSKNSSKPSPQTEKDESALNDKGSKSKGNRLTTFQKCSHFSY